MPGVISNVSSVRGVTRVHFVDPASKETLPLLQLLQPSGPALKLVALYLPDGHSSHLDAPTTLCARVYVCV